MSQGKTVRVRLTEYYPFAKNLTTRQRKMEGGIKDRKSKPLYSLEDYIDGSAPYVSLACDFKGGAPGNRKEFRVYGYEAWIPELEKKVGYDKPIIFRLVDTGGNFFGANKKVRVTGREPIDVCRRAKPSKEHSFSGMLADLILVGPAGAIPSRAAAEEEHRYIQNVFGLMDIY